MQKKNAPAVRFAGFEGEWERKRLGDVILIERGGSPRPIDDFITNDKNGLNWVKIGDAPDMGNLITQTAEKIRPEGLCKTREVYPGDLILSNSMSFGKPYIMGISGCIHDGWLLIRNERGVFVLNFLCQLLGTEQMLEQYRSLAAGSTVNNLNKELVGNTVVKFPTIPEQNALANFFSHLDRLITLNKQKYERLQNVKTAMLGKMFPKEGARVPEIRFSGFLGEWERKRLGELCQITTGKLDANAMVENGEFDFYTSGVEVYRIDIAAFEGPAITIAGNGAVGYIHLADGKFNAYQRTYVLTDFQADRQFLSSEIDQVLPQKIQAEVRGSSIPYIVMDMLTELIILLPNEAEQAKLGKFFFTLDRLITLNKEKYERLQNIKTAMLGRMFV